MSRIGYACKVIGVPGTGIRSCILKSATRERLSEVAAANLSALDAMVRYNRAAGIDLFRISSDIIPFGSHPAVDFPWRDMFSGQLAVLGQTIRQSGLRVSMHPGQYTVLNSPDEDVAERAILDLEYHAAFLDALDTGPDAKIILHIGGVYGDRAAALRRFAERYSRLSPAVARRLVLENDEKCYTLEEVMQAAEEVGAPVVMDVFHFQLNPSPGDWRDWLRRAGETWGSGDGRQKIHYSQQLLGGKAGMHSRTIVASEFVELYNTLPEPRPDIMLEVKDKNLSAIKCRLAACGARRAGLTAEWARYKYAVLEHDQRAYSEIRTLLKQDSPDPVAFYGLVESALDREPDGGAILNAVEHVWGHFKNKADAREKKRYLRARDSLHDGSLSLAAVKRFLLSLAEKYEDEYLRASLYFYLDAI